MPAFSRAFVDNTDASGTGTYHVKSRFVSGGVRVHTTPASRYLRLRLGNSNRRLQSLSTTFLKSGAFRVKSGETYCWKYTKRPPNAAKHLSQVSVLTTYCHWSPPMIFTVSSPSVSPGGGTAFNAIVTGILPAPVAATRTGPVISQYGSS